MLGTIPSGSKTYEVQSYLDDGPFEDGKLYADRSDGRLYYYSRSVTRSCPATGYFPIWDGSKKYISEFSLEKYLGRDTISMSLAEMSASIDKQTAERVTMDRWRSESAEILQPSIGDDDNMFTQCIKGVICQKQLTMVDLYSMGCPPLMERTVDNYYASLTKISFMRMDKWHVWLDVILKVRYRVTVYRGSREILTYYHPEEIFETGVSKYDNIVKLNADPFKKIIMILMIMENITKSSLKSDTINDYTINNMMTTVANDKSMSAQLFSRFIRMAELSYQVDLFDGDQTIFTYRE